MRATGAWDYEILWQRNAQEVTFYLLKIAFREVSEHVIYIYICKINTHLRDLIPN